MTRNHTIDMMKGVAIIAMMIGHLGLVWEVNLFFFIWRMPLYFIITGYFAKNKDWKTSFYKNLRWLIVPYIVTALVLAVFAYVQSDYDIDTLKHHIKAVVVGSGSLNNPTFLRLYFVGAIWFLQAMFWSRMFYNTIAPRLNMTRLLILSFVLSFIGSIVGRYIFIPTNMLQGLCALVFVCAGAAFRQYGLFEKKPSILIVVGIILIDVCSYIFGLSSLCTCEFSCFPVNVIAAIGSVYLLYHICLYLQRINYVSRVLSHFGRMTIIILCVHIVELDYDKCIPPFYNYLPHGVTFATMCYRIVLVLAISEIIYRTPYLKDVFIKRKLTTYE